MLREKIAEYNNWKSAEFHTLRGKPCGGSNPLSAISTATHLGSIQTIVQLVAHQLHTLTVQVQVLVVNNIAVRTFAVLNIPV